MTMNLKQYAASRGIKAGTVKRWATEGMPVHRIASAVRVVESEADDWVEHRYPNTIARHRTSMVYIARDPYSKRIKIGYSTDVPRRMAEIAANTGGAELLCSFAGDARLERLLHERFASARVDGEWFEPVPELLEFARCAA